MVVIFALRVIEEATMSEYVRLAHREPVFQQPSTFRPFADR